MLAKFQDSENKESHDKTAFVNGSSWLFLWSEWRDSNSRPPAPKAGALPTALHPVIKFIYPAGRILPNQARYQLRYTRILFQYTTAAGGREEKIFGLHK